MKRRPVSRREWLLVAVALAAYIGLASTAVRNKSNTFDEIAHLTAGFTYWAFDDYRLQPENGNWPQRLAGLPAYLFGATPPDRGSEAWRRGNVWSVGDAFFFNTGNDIDRFLWAGRVLITGLGAGVALCVFVWARRLTGVAGGWLALVLCGLSPTMLAHGAVVTSDMAAALGLLLAVSLVWRGLHLWSPFTIGASAVATAGVLLAKFSGVIVVPLAVVLGAIRWWRGGPVFWRWHRGQRWRPVAGPGRHAVAMAVAVAVHAVVALLLIWGSYGWRYSAFAEGAPVSQSFMTPWTTLLDDGKRTLAKQAVQQARQWRVLPEAYLYGFSHTTRFAEERPSYLNGEVAMTGRVAFFPTAFALKTTVPLLLLIVAGAGGIAAGRGGWRVRARWYRAVPLAVLATVYGLAALTTNLNIGHRHLLPIYPVLFVLAGAGAIWLPAAGRAARRGVLIALAGLAGWHAIESFRVRPHYLAYFNQFAGGPAGGYRHLVDSSLDWGQELPGLAGWLREHVRPGEPVYLSYFGTARPSHFGIEARTLPGFLDWRTAGDSRPYEPGVYVISATMWSGAYLSTAGRWMSTDEAQYQALAASVEALISDPELHQAAIRERGEDPLPATIAAFDDHRFARLVAFLRSRTPDAQVGYSLLVFRLSADELQRTP